MYPEPPIKTPHLDWTLDRWKIGLILALFVGLTIASITRPPRSDIGKLPAALAIEEAADNPDPAATADDPAAAGEENPEQGNKALILPGARMPADILRLPLTLANFGPNAVAPPGSINVLAGTAAAHSNVKVLDQWIAPSNRTDLSPGKSQDLVLGLATASDHGLWQLALTEPLTTGQHILTLQELGGQNELTAVSSPAVITVLADGEEGPLALATPIIRSPALGARIAPGPVEFTGTGMPGMLVRLSLNGNEVADGLVTAQDDWRISPEEELTPGVYTAWVTALNPQGEVLAESAHVIFVVEEPAESSLPLTLPTPTLPLTISGLAYSDRRRTTLLVNGLATPHSAIAAWMAGEPVKAVNASQDGHWQLSLVSSAGFDSVDNLEVRSSFGERVRTDTQLQQPVPAALPTRPRLLSPRPGEVLTNPRPLLSGIAQPLVDVAILVNRQVVGAATADPHGVWTFRMVDPLPSGAVALAAGWMADLVPEQLAAPVVVMVVPNHKTLAAQGPLQASLRLDQKPSTKIYYRPPTGP